MAKVNYNWLTSDDVQSLAVENNLTPLEIGNLTRYFDEHPDIDDDAQNRLFKIMKRIKKTFELQGTPNRNASDDPVIPDETINDLINNNNTDIAVSLLPEDGEHLRILLKSGEFFDYMQPPAGGGKKKKTYKKKLRKRRKSTKKRRTKRKTKRTTKRR